MNSREKGKRGERQWRDELRANGYDARRGQQFCGSADSPDVICDALPWLHTEVKCVERLNIEDAMEQARRDAGNKVPVVAHKRNFCGWLVTMDAETFFKFLRGDFLTAENAKNAEAFAGGHTTISEVSGESPDTTREARVLPENRNNETKENENENQSE